MEKSWSLCWQSNEMGTWEASDLTFWYHVLVLQMNHASYNVMIWTVTRRLNCKLHIGLTVSYILFIPSSEIWSQFSVSADKGAIALSVKSRQGRWSRVIHISVLHLHLHINTWYTEENIVYRKTKLRHPSMFFYFIHRKKFPNFSNKRSWVLTFTSKLWKRNKQFRFEQTVKRFWNKELSFQWGTWHSEVWCLLRMTKVKASFICILQDRVNRKNLSNNICTVCISYCSYNVDTIRTQKIQTHQKVHQL